MLGLNLNVADFDFTKDANHHLSVEQISRMCGLCNDFVKVMIPTLEVVRIFAFNEITG